MDTEEDLDEKESRAAKREASRLEHIREAANNAARVVAKSHLTFLVFCTYVAITLGSTTHEDLLKVSPVILPLLNLKVPIVACYALAPWLLVLLHFNLLMQCYFLARKFNLLAAVLTTIKTKKKRYEQLSLLYDLPLTQMLLGSHHGQLMSFLFMMVVWITFILLPLSLLVGVQIRFLPYHDSSLTWNQRASVLFDLLILWVLWPRIVSPNGSLYMWLSRAFSLLGSFHLMFASLGHLLKSRWRWQSAQESFKRKADVGNLQGFFPLTLLSLLTLLLTHFIAVIPHEYMEFKLLRVGTRLLFDRPGALFQRNIQLPEKLLVADQAAVAMAYLLRNEDKLKRDEDFRKSVGLNLVGRDLRYANFRNSALPNANLRGANLEGADLGESDLFSADLRPIDLSDGGNCPMKAQEVRLGVMEQSGLPVRGRSGKYCVANLKDARLWNASMIGARLVRAQLDGADLRFSQLQGADLRFATFHGATFTHTKLQAANMYAARLEGAADLLGVQLQGADLRGAGLRATNLRYAKLQGADLRGASLEGADLMGAQLQGATLEGAQLIGADMREVAVAGADFSNANLSLSDQRNLTRQPLTQKQYEEIEREYAPLSHLLDPEVNHKNLLFLSAMRQLIGKPGQVGATRQAEGVLCARDPVFSTCIDEHEMQRYEALLVPFLAKLGCETKASAALIAARVLNSFENKNEGNRPNLQPVAEALLKSDCIGAQTLPDRVKQLLGQGQRGAPPRK